MPFLFAVLALALFAIPVRAGTVDLSTAGGVAYERPNLCGPDAVDMSEILTRAMAAQGSYLNQHEYVLPNGYNCFFHPVTVVTGAVVRGAGAFGYVVRAGSPANNEEALFSLQNSSRLENLMIFAGSGTSGGICCGAGSAAESDPSLIPGRGRGGDSSCGT